MGQELGGTMKREIKVKVTLTPGYEKRFTEACLEQIKKREKREASA